MTPSAVKGYCLYLFDQAGINFYAWWNGNDPELKMIPSEACIDMPKLVIERAEHICELQRSAA